MDRAFLPAARDWKPLPLPIPAPSLISHPRRDRSIGLWYPLRPNKANSAREPRTPQPQWTRTGVRPLPPRTPCARPTVPRTPPTWPSPRICTRRGSRIRRRFRPIGGRTSRPFRPGATLRAVRSDRGFPRTRSSIRRAAVRAGRMATRRATDTRRAPRRTRRRGLASRTSCGASASAATSRRGSIRSGVRVRVIPSSSPRSTGSARRTWGGRLRSTPGRRR